MRSVIIMARVRMLCSAFCADEFRTRSAPRSIGLCPWLRLKGLSAPTVRARGLSVKPPSEGRADNGAGA